MAKKKFSRKERSDADGFFVSGPTFITNRRTCVSVKIMRSAVKVRHTKDHGRILTFSHPEWKAFIKGVKDNEFDL